MTAMPISPAKRRQFDRILRRERVVRTLEIAPAIIIGTGVFLGLGWLWSHGGPAIGLALAGATALAKPTLIVIRVLESRRHD
jgi:L-asparagine transporter-like permease